MVAALLSFAAESGKSASAAAGAAGAGAQSGPQSLFPSSVETSPNVNLQPIMEILRRKGGGIGTGG